MFERGASRPFCGKRRDGREDCVYKRGGRESGCLREASPVHPAEKVEMDGRFVYTSAVDGEAGV